MLHGGFRKLLQKPIDLEWKITKWSNLNEDILSLDSSNPLYILDTDGDKKALVLQFALPKSSYATMMLREVIHDTSEFNMEENISN